jgi:hypothetical protein
MAGVMGLTHYCNMGSYMLGFTLSSCENCGGPVQSAEGAVNLIEPESRMASLGLEKFDGAPPADEYYSEAIEGCACDSCGA